MENPRGQGKAPPVRSNIAQIVQSAQYSSGSSAAQVGEFGDFGNGHFPGIGAEATDDREAAGERLNELVAAFWHGNMFA